MLDDIHIDDYASRGHAVVLGSTQKLISKSCWGKIGSIMLHTHIYVYTLFELEKAKFTLAALYDIYSSCVIRFII